MDFHILEVKKTVKKVFGTIKASTAAQQPAASIPSLNYRNNNNMEKRTTNDVKNKKFFIKNNKMLE